MPYNESRDKMIKNVSDPSVASILSTDALKVYNIPRYQREYTWGQQDWASLYDDVFGNDQVTSLDPSSSSRARSTRRPT